MSVVTFCPKFYAYGRFVRKYVRTDKISDGHFTILAVFGRNLSGIRPLSPKNGRNMSRSVSEIPGISELTRIPGISCNVHTSERIVFGANWRQIGAKSRNLAPNLKIWRQIRYLAPIWRQIVKFGAKIWHRFGAKSAPNFRIWRQIAKFFRFNF